MSQLKRLLKERNIIKQQQQDLVNFLAVLVHRQGDSIEIPVTELKELPEKQFQINVEDEIFHIKLIENVDKI